MNFDSRIILPTSLQTTSAFLNFGREPQSINLFPGQYEATVEVVESSPKEWRERIERIQTLKD